MNLETRVHEDLWAEIRRSYTEKRYSDAIKDAIVYLSDIIRSKSGLEIDGVALVGSAFGGASPKVRVSKLESQSDKDVQAGMEAILRGVYLGVRNPRHHGKVNDTEDDADAIILFIDYLVRIIGKAKAQFSMDDCLRTAFDEAFVESSQYADLIVSEIPEKHRLDVFVEAFQRLGTGQPRKLRYFFEALLKVLPAAECEQAIGIISKALRVASPTGEIQPILGIMREGDWQRIDQVARLRTEGIVIESIRDGAYNRALKKCTGGALATWASGYLAHFDRKDAAYSALRDNLLSDSKAKRAYVLHFFSSLSGLKESPSTWEVQSFKDALAAGKQEVHEHLSFLADFGDAEDPWVKPFIESLEKFQPKQETASVDEDVPF